jgi:hypothetical protein
MPTLSERSRYRLTVTFEGGQARGMEHAMAKLREAGEISDFKLEKLIVIPPGEPTIKGVSLATLRALQDNGGEGTAMRVDQIGALLEPAYSASSASSCCSALEKAGFVRRVGRSAYQLTEKGLTEKGLAHAD